jgi:hypothetical protein
MNITSTADNDLFAVILTESLRPVKKSKAELEQMAKANGAQIVQRESTADNLIIIADRRNSCPS